MAAFRVEVQDQPAHVSGDFVTADEAEHIARSYAVEDRLAATVIDADREPVSKWEPLSLDGLTELQIAIYEYVRSKHKRTIPVDVEELAAKLGRSQEAVSNSLAAPLTERHLNLRPAGPGRESWIILDSGSIDAAWRRSRLH